MTTINHHELIAALRKFGKINDEAEVANLVLALSNQYGGPVGDVAALVNRLAKEWVAAYSGGLPFVRSVQRTVVGGGALSVKQLKGVLNCMRADPAGTGMKFTTMPATATGDRPKSYGSTLGITIAPLSSPAWGDSVTKKPRGGFVYSFRGASCGRMYIVTQPVSGRWADFIFIAGGVGDETFNENFSKPHLLPKIGMQPPGGEFRLAASLPVTLAEVTSAISQLPQTASGAPQPPTPTVEKVATVVTANTEPAAPKPKAKPVKAGAKVRKEVAAPQPEPESEPVPAGVSIRDLVRQRNGLI